MAAVITLIWARAQRWLRRLPLHASTLCCLVLLTYLGASLLNAPPLLRAIIAFPAVYLVPGVLVLLVIALLRRRGLPSLRRVLLEAFLLSTLLTVAYTSLLILLGSPVEGGFRLFAGGWFLVSVVLAVRRLDPPWLVASGDYHLVALAVLTFLGGVLLFGHLPRTWAPGELESVASVEALSGGALLQLGKGSGLRPILDSRLFWPMLLTAFQASTGLDARGLHLMGLAFLAMIPFAFTLLIPAYRERQLRVVLVALQVTNPLLLLFAGLGSLDALATAFYTATALVFFVQAFTVAGGTFPLRNRLFTALVGDRQVSLRLAELLKALGLALLVTLIQVNPFHLAVFVGMWLWLALINFTHRVYRASTAHKLVFLLLILLPIGYVVLVNLPYYIIRYLVGDWKLAEGLGALLIASPVTLLATILTRLQHISWAYFLDHLYLLLAPEGLTLPVSALALLLPGTLLLRRWRQDIQRRSLVVVTTLALVTYLLLRLSDLAPSELPVAPDAYPTMLSEASQHALSLVPALLFIATLLLSEWMTRSPLSLLLLAFPMLLFLGLNHQWSQVHAGGVPVAWSVPPVTWSYLPLLAIFLTYLTLTNLKLVDAIPPRLDRNLFPIVILLLVVSNLYFSHGLITHSISYHSPVAPTGDVTPVYTTYPPPQSIPDIPGTVGLVPGSPLIHIAFTLLTLSALAIYLSALLLTRLPPMRQRSSYIA